MSGLQVIALISGGKDSLFSMLHCIANGHKVVALANLYSQSASPELDLDVGTLNSPHDISNVFPEDVDEDMNSHMYQTVGHGVVPLYATALELPLYRGRIQGIAVNMAKSYHPTCADLSDAATNKEDETESLIPLLRQCMAAHPEANAVSTGAILSAYQRTRVESVATRLGLVSLSFLWQYPFLPPHTQTSLLEDMAAVGQDARIVKVASGGLDERHLWMNVADPSTIMRLTRDMSKFAGPEIGAVLGEGGEYESLTIDGPTPLWKRKVLVSEAEMTVVRSEGGCAVVRIRKATTVEKKDAMPINALRIPSPFDSDFMAILEQSKTFEPPKQARLTPATPLHYAGRTIPESSFMQGERFYVSNINSSGSISTAAQMEDIVARLVSLLQTHGIGTSNIVFTTILLRSMSDFSDVNDIYSRLFNEPNPPARITIACGTTLPEDVNVALSIVAMIRKGESECLHVQSRSYWAPANIGPYSQAISVPLRPKSEEGPGVQVIYVAGQIPLIPASMQLVSGAFDEQAVLSLQHLWRIGRAMNVHWWTDVVVFITAPTSLEARRRAMRIANIWQMAHHNDEERSTTEEEQPDISHDSLYRSWMTSNRSRAHDVRQRSPLPRWSRIKKGLTTQESNVKSPKPPILIVQIHELPRGAQVEWGSTGVRSGGHITVEADGSCCLDGYSVSVECCDNICSTHEHSDAVREIYAEGAALKQLNTQICARVIPCNRIFDANGEEHNFGVVRRISDAHGIE